ncbi:S8 family serine peptidase [Lysobacter yananisis]|uniref:S8 family serine peptidase n=1 Tax=Lysobacter yananisis TaxID=1003114 RepID=A0ABY9P7A7_9GAMM|nr:S8 family serine peptidase [Lysobacter yananisis]WMT02871.1 S8 family serine peptidase [Lysobacter yananisis]
MPNAKNRLTIAIALGLSGLTALAAAAAVGGLNRPAASADASVGGAPAPQRAAPADSAGQRYVVLYQEAPLSVYNGEVAGLAAPQRVAGAQNANSAAARIAGGGNARIDVRGAQASRYLNYLDNVQRNHERSINAALGRTLKVERRLRHAVNGAVVRMSASEAARVAKLPGVALVQASRDYPLDTDVGPQLIGAPALWNAKPTQWRGEGVVVGILDTGINFGSPAFAAIDDSGYRHVNPNGAGQYLGTCAPGGVDEGRCNDKLIGGWDFVCGEPANMCGQPGIREEPGFGDTNGHGSHTASTSAGNAWTANYKGRDIRISGVAPHANIVAYDICYTDAAGQGWCPDSAALAAIDQAVVDGVDVINYSIGGGGEPWGEAVSLAFLNASDAGIFIAASAGNSGPDPSTNGHQQPWVSTTAASTHGRGNFATLLQITGPGTVPSDLQAVQLNDGSGGVSLTASIPPNTPVRISAGIDSADDGCAGFAPGAFANAIAVVRRGTCNFSIKVNNAAAAGAIAVVIANNQATGVTPSVPGTTVPAFAAAQDDSNALRDFAAGNGNTSTGGIGFPPTPVPNTPDLIADFSSRGPGGFNLIKPDVAAPGVSVLAVLAGTTIGGSENLVGLLSGTSMASPHQAGSAALLRQARPNWTAAEIKSALMMTAREGMLLEDGVTAANPFDTGSGRIQVDQAVKSGLVLNETTARYRAADPAAGGDPAQLNLASMQQQDCKRSCTFQRSFRHAQGVLPELWLAQVEGVDGIAFPPVFVSAPGSKTPVSVFVFSRKYAADGSWHFGKLQLKPLLGRKSPSLHLPIAVSVPAPTAAAVAAAAAAAPKAVRADRLGARPVEPERSAR